VDRPIISSPSYMNRAVTSRWDTNQLACTGLQCNWFVFPWNGKEVIRGLNAKIVSSMRLARS